MQCNCLALWSTKKKWSPSFLGTSYISFSEQFTVSNWNLYLYFDFRVLLLWKLVIWPSGLAQVNRIHPLSDTHCKVIIFDNFQLQSCVRSLSDFKNDFYFWVIKGLLNRQNCANFSRNKALECRSEWARVCYTPNCKSMGHFADVLVVDNG